MKLKSVLKVILIFLFSLVVLAVYFYVSFLAGGYGILAGARGTDSWAYFSRLKLLADYFPKFPFWNNLEGGGISLTHSYPILTNLIIIVTSKLTSFSLAEPFKLWGFLFCQVISFVYYLLLDIFNLPFHFSVISYLSESDSRVRKWLLSSLKNSVSFILNIESSLIPKSFPGLFMHIVARNGKIDYNNEVF